MTNVSVIITNWNGKKIITKSLPVILKNSPEANEVIFIDDASGDTSVEFVKELQKKDTRIKIIVNKDNKGFGKTSNIAVKSCKNKLVVMLNNDIYPEANYIRACLPHFKNEHVYGVGFAEVGNENYSRIYWKNGYLQYEGIQDTRTHITSWVSGGSAIINKDIFIKLGGFDDAYAPFYSEDLDLGLRAWRSGYKLLWEPKARVFHKHESTTSKFPKRFLEYVKERNRLLVVLRNISDPNLLLQNKLAQYGRVLMGPNYIKIIRAAYNRNNEVPKQTVFSKYTDKELLNIFNTI